MVDDAMHLRAAVLRQLLSILLFFLFFGNEHGMVLRHGSWSWRVLAAHATYLPNDCPIIHCPIKTTAPSIVVKGVAARGASRKHKLYRVCGRKEKEQQHLQNRSQKIKKTVE